jgi:hypothetical protein
MASLPINRLPSEVEMPESPEKARIVNRRKRNRAQLHWPISFPLTGTTETVRTITQDLSSDGFYCIANARFVPGEARHCTLLVPTHHPGGENSPLQVLCKVRIIRVEVTGERGFYGVGCQIMDYRLVKPAHGMELQGTVEHPDTLGSQLNVSNRNL